LADAVNDLTEGDDTVRNL